MTKPTKTNKPFNYVKAIRWFTAEFLVVLSGVLVAVALGNYFKEQYIKDQNRQYLTDLLEELRHNKQEVQKNLLTEHAGARGAELLIAHIDTARQVPMDSIQSWLGDCLRSTINFRPAMGMVKTMITLGNVNSLNDFKLRSDIINYEQEATELADVFSHMTSLEFRQVEKLIDQGSINRFMTDSKSQKPLTFKEIRGNEQYTKLFLMSYILYTNRILLYEGYVEQLDLLSNHIEVTLKLKKTTAAAVKYKQK